MIELIERKRDGGELTTAQIEQFVTAVTRGDAPDYQVAALLMAIYLQGMSRRETVDLTLAMVRSGEELSLHDVVPIAVDKHSSGGVGDKTTLVVLPLVAACGLAVGKMSGRGLGSSGGTLDKMESITGWSCDVPMGQFKRQLADIGIALAGQTADLAPADGKLYALRDVTGTVASIPLIAASIMSKKLAGGADGIVLDVKVGSGAFMPTVEAARELARIMVDIGTDAGREVVALLSDMNQPLGHAIGNTLEVQEAVETLRGKGPSDFWTHCVAVAGQMLLLGKKTSSLEQAEGMLLEARDSGRALAKFREMVVAQGGDGKQIDDTTLLPLASHVEMVFAPRDGYLSAVDAGALGWAGVNLGGGRKQKGDVIDHAVGIVLSVKIGDFIPAGTPVATIHANQRDHIEPTRQAILNALTWSDTAVDPLPHFYGTVTRQSEI